MHNFGCNYNDFNHEDSLKQYIKEIGNYPLLTREEEIELFNKIINGDNKAKELFIKCNLKLVVSVAKKYADRGIDILDIIQEGNIGLMKAVDKFDATKGCKFSTYATYWIDNYISNLFINTSKTIRYPADVYNLTKKYKAVEAKLEQQLYREPTIEEIATEMQIAIEQAKNLRNFSMDTTSIDNELTEDASFTLADIIPSDINIEEDYLEKDRLIQLKEIILSANLKKENIEILLLRYCDQMPLREIGKKYNIGHQSVSCKLDSSIKKIKKRTNIEHLRTYI